MTTNKTTAKTTAKNNAKGDKAMTTKKTEKKVEKSNSEKFSELANIRVPKALRVIKSISSLANDDRYDYTDEQSDAILNALKSAVDEVTQCFENGGQKDEEVFRI
ncbi:hypothetical protein [Endozoicomonas ascidiicola]|uniref:hypothetical protein n=1 Tax=Endozoicomonas ascidiicola TaxID=1698521 RepID=UPI000B23DCC6|nr:hypothetical protein [Endozoicomonas ascidiicola]